jgi:hypothetical protein
MPVSGLSPIAFQPNSGVVVLPRITAPASRSRATAGLSSDQSCAGSMSFEPRKVGKPRISTMSLIVTGTPSSGPSDMAWRQRCSEARAAARAPSRSTTQKALSRGSKASIRANRISAASIGDSAFLRYRSANASAEVKAISDPLVMSPPPCRRRDYQPIAMDRQRRTLRS